MPDRIRPAPRWKSRYLRRLALPHPAYAPKTWWDFDRICLVCYVYVRPREGLAYVGFALVHLENCADVFESLHYEEPRDYSRSKRGRMRKRTDGAWFKVSNGATCVKCFPDRSQWIHVLRILLGKAI
jgi:hypothetical protein